MRRYDEIKKDFVEVEYPAQQINYFAYKEGKVYGPYDFWEDAKNISKNVEKVTVDNDQYQKQYEAYQEYRSNVVSQWEKELREAYSYLSDEVYKIALSYAYDRGHSSGYDEVANYMIDYVEFAEKVLATVKK